jgi:hypothetical protein
VLDLALSGEAEEWGENDHDGYRPDGEDGDVGGLPSLEARRRVLTSQDELLPQSATVLAGELPCQGVEVTHSLQRNEERLIGGETDHLQLGDLVAKMTFQLMGAVPAIGTATLLQDRLWRVKRQTRRLTGRSGGNARVTGWHCRPC